MRRLLGLKDLVHDAIDKTTELVEQTHAATGRRVVNMLSIVEPLGDAARAVVGAQRTAAAAVYATIRATNRGVQTLADAGVALAAPVAAERTRATPVESTPRGTLSRWVDAAQGALNAMHGDFLRARDNGLAIRMGVRQDGRTVRLSRASLARAFPDATGRVAVFVHGLGCTEWEWRFRAEALHGDPDVSFGTMLARDLGITPLYVRYNTGLHVSENGRALSDLLGEVVAAYPRRIDEIVLVGHSMGGLVARSAAHYGADRGAAWVDRLGHVICIGAPNLGAPLEKGANLLASALRALDTAATQVPAAILNARSAGIKDLRFGYVVDEDWRGKDPDARLEDNRRDIPFVDGATYYFVAASLTRDPDHPLGQLLGDALVRLPSAAGRAPQPARRIPFHLGRTFGGIGHLTLQNHPDVYAAIRAWLSGGD